jgi:hypothetical protein
MAGLLLALIVVAVFGLLFWMFEGDDWSRMRQGNLPRPSMGAVGPWMRDVLHLPRGGEGHESRTSEAVQTQPPNEPKVSAPPETPAQPQVLPDPPPEPQRSVEASVYDRLYGGPRSVRKEERDD